MAKREGAGWSTGTVVEATTLPLGQLVSLAIDADDALHIAYFEGSPSDGSVQYAKSAG